MGISKKLPVITKLKYMLVMEEERYISIAAFISIVLSACCSLVIKRIIEDIFQLFEYHFTLVPVVGLIAVYVVIAVFSPIIMYHNMKKVL